MSRRRCSSGRTVPRSRATIWSKPSLSSVKTWVGVRVTTLALRGASFSRASSPKNAPAPSVVIDLVVADDVGLAALDHVEPIAGLTLHDHQFSRRVGLPIAVLEELAAIWSIERCANGGRERTSRRRRGSARRSARRSRPRAGDRTWSCPPRTVPRSSSRGRSRRAAPWSRGRARRIRRPREGPERPGVAGLRVDVFDRQFARSDDVDRVGAFALLEDRPTGRDRLQPDPAGEVREQILGEVVEDRQRRRSGSRLRSASDVSRRNRTRLTSAFTRRHPARTASRSPRIKPPANARTSSRRRNRVNHPSRQRSATRSRRRSGARRRWRRRTRRSCTPSRGCRTARDPSHADRCALVGRVSATGRAG